MAEGAQESLVGRYRLLSRVGAGGMGTVWKAHDDRLDRTVAVKRLRLDGAATGTASHDAAVRRAMREGRVAARLRHPHAIAVHDVVEHDGTPCLVMEYLPSRSLSAILAERGTLPVADVARIGAQVSAALAEAHAVGIVHRDVKPGNVLLADDSEAGLTAKIADFGISHATGESTVTGEDVIAGTPAYLSPEVADGGPAVAASDVYSLGATLFAALEGHPPVGEVEHPAAVLRKIADGELVAPRRCGALTDVLTRMLARAPAERPTMAQARDAFGAVAEGGHAELPTRDPTLLLPPRRGPGGLRRRTVVLGAAAGALVAVGVLIGVSITQDSAGRADGRTDEPAPGPSPSAPSTEMPDQRCSAGYAVTNQWPGGFQVEVTVRNDATESLTGWRVSWQRPDGERVDGLWNGELTTDDTTITVGDATWNATVERGATTTFGFNGTRTTDAPPALPTLTCRPS